MKHYEKIILYISICIYIFCTLCASFCTIKMYNKILEEENKPIETFEIDEEPAISKEEVIEVDEFDANTLDWDYSYVMRVVGAEARGISDEGIKAVCEVIYNRAKESGMTPEEVVKQKGQFTSPMPSEFYYGGEIVNELCLLTFACDEMWFDEPIIAFCTVGCNSKWHNSLHYCFTIDNVNFYSYKEA